MLAIILKYFFTSSTGINVIFFFVVDRSARKQKKREGKEAQACRRGEGRVAK
jgi:hypothetical protein